MPDDEYRIEEEKEPEGMKMIKAMVRSIEADKTSKEVQTMVDMCIGILMQVRASVAINPMLSELVSEDVDNVFEMATKIVKKVNRKGRKKNE